MTKAKSQRDDAASLGDAGFLRALQITDSFFPTGMVTLSHGLETFIQEEGISTEEEFEQLLEDYLRNQLGVGDAVALANAHRAADQGDMQAIIEIDLTLTSMKLVRESRESSVKTGGRMLAVSRRLTEAAIVQQLQEAVDQGESPGNYAVALGVVSAVMGIPCRQAMLMELYSFAVSFLAVAVRLGRLHYLQVQDILQRSGETIINVVDENINKPIHDIRSFAPAIDMMGMKHQRADRRLFVS